MFTWGSYIFVGVVKVVRFINARCGGIGGFAWWFVGVFFWGWLAKLVKAEFILRHTLVPKAEVLSESEAEELLKKLGVRREQLPWMLEDDPLAKAIKAKSGDIVKLIRKSPVAGEAIAYRVVVPGKMAEGFEGEEAEEEAPAVEELEEE